MTLQELRGRRDEGKDRLWWCWRIFDESVKASEVPGEQVDTETAIDCFLELAQADPEWALARGAEQGPPSHQLAQLFGNGDATKLADRIRLKNAGQEAMLRAEILCVVAQWSKSDTKPLFERAWAELRRVPDEGRDSSWIRFALSATAVVDYPSFRPLMGKRLESIEEDFWKAASLPSAISTAAHHKDWVAFETWLAQYRALPPAMTHGHAACAIVGLEGLRALDEGRHSDAEHHMRRLLDLAKGETFLSNDDIAELPKRLRKEGRNIDLCDAFDALVAAREWRRLTG